MIRLLNHQLRYLAVFFAYHAGWLTWLDQKLVCTFLKQRKPRTEPLLLPVSLMTCCLLIGLWLLHEKKGADTLQNSLADLKFAMGALRGQLDQSKNEYAALRLKYDQAKEDTRKGELVSANAALREDLAQVEASHAQLIRDYDEVLTDLEQVKQSHATLKSNLLDELARSQVAFVAKERELAFLVHQIDEINDKKQAQTELLTAFAQFLQMEAYSGQALSIEQMDSLAQALKRVPQDEGATLRLVQAEWNSDPTMMNEVSVGDRTTQIPATVQNDEYLATAITEVGDFPLPEKVGSLATTIAKHLVQFNWSFYSGAKIRVSVLPVENASSVASVNAKLIGPDDHKDSTQEPSQLVPIQGIETLITDTLIQTGRFTVLERARLHDLFMEQNFGRSGRVSKMSPANVGKIFGSEFNVKLKITDYEPNASLKGFGLGKSLLGRIGKKRSVVTIVFQLIDAETSEIVFSKKVTAVISKKGFSVGGKEPDGSISRFSKTPIGQAIIAAINIGSFEFVKVIGNYPNEGKIISVNDDLVVLNMGSNKKLLVGDRLIVKSKEKEMVDPETGLSLGSRTRNVGILLVVEVHEKFCFAKPVGFDVSQVKPGDVAIATKAPPKLKFAESWTGPKGKKMKKKRKP